jgi:hypothetical protein
MISPATKVSRRSRRLHTTACLLLSSSCSWSNPGIAATSSGANLHACIYIPTPPSIQVDYNFTVASSQCMEKPPVGKENAITAKVTFKPSKAGVMCADLGYVGQQGWDNGGDNCYGINQGLAVLSYAGGFQNADSGSTQTNWWSYLLYDSHMALGQSSPASTKVCLSDALCSATAQQWSSGVPDLYIIFQPGTSASTNALVNLNSAPVEKDLEREKRPSPTGKDIERHQ